MVFGIPSKEDLDEVIKKAPENLFKGIVEAVSFAPEKMKGAILFGEDLWNKMTPEQQEKCEKAAIDLIEMGCDAVIKSKAK